ncbi:hypothetical protein [Shewanella sp. 0m-4]
MSRKKLLLSTALLISVSAYTKANIIVDSKNVDPQQYHADMYECEQLSQQVEPQSSNSLGHDILKSTAKGRPSAPLAVQYRVAVALAVPKRGRE